jgi:hypothetical protein
MSERKEADKRSVLAPVAHSNKVQQPPADEPGVINGAKNPELIPDLVAYSLLFRFVSGAQNTEAKKRVRHYVRQMGLGDQTSNFCSQEDQFKSKGDDRDLDAFTVIAEEFRQRVSPLDQQAVEIRKQHWPNINPEVKAELTRLQSRKEAIVAELIASLPKRLSADGVNKVRMHVNERMKRRIKMPARRGPVADQSLAHFGSRVSFP